MKRPTLVLRPWQRRLAYAGFALVSFTLALRLTFPAEAVKERLVLEAAARGWSLSAVDVAPSGLAGIGMTGVTLESSEGLRIPLERVDASVRLLSFLRGGRGLTFSASLFDGRVKGFVEEGSVRRHLAATVTGVDLARAAALRKAVGLDLGGKVAGEVDLTLDEREPARSSGHLDLEVRDAALNGGEVQVPGMGGALSVPRVALGQVTARAVAKDGRLAFERLESKGGDLEVSGEGLYCVLGPRLAYAPIFGKVRLVVRDAFWSRSGTAGFKSVAELALAQARGKDGSFGFQIFGTLGQPQARMGL